MPEQNLEIRLEQKLKQLELFDDTVRNSRSLFGATAANHAGNYSSMNARPAHCARERNYNGPSETPVAA